MEEITYHVPEIHCEACEGAIKRALAEREGIDVIDVDLDRKRVTVRFDGSKATAVDIRDRIEKAGFDVA